MILKHRSVEVKFVRQMKSWNITTEVGCHGVNFYEVKETNTDTLRLVEDKVFELEHHDNQEIEVLQCAMLATVITLCIHSIMHAQCVHTLEQL